MSNIIYYSLQVQSQFYERILHVSLGPALYGLSAIGAMGSQSLGFVQALVFASFIVAVDPVAVSYHNTIVRKNNLKCLKSTKI